MRLAEIRRLPEVKRAESARESWEARNPQATQRERDAARRFYMMRAKGEYDRRRGVTVLWDNPPPGYSEGRYGGGAHARPEGEA